MATGTVQTIAPAPAAAKERFFEAYHWCLNPMLSLRDLLQHLGEEVELYRANSVAGWQAEERRINLYLFACAIACTIDDHLAARPWNVSALARRFPSARTAIRAAESVLNTPHAWRSHSEAARAAGWRHQWAGCVDAACELLLGGDDTQFCEQASRLLAAAASALGESAQRQRMRIPEAFRCQDLTHQDVCAMVRLCLPALPEKDRPIIIVGPRTAGAYFAPLAAARLRALGYTRVTWLTVRPKNGLTRTESHAISRAISAHAQLLIVDDHPNSGHTLRLLLTALRGLGAASPDMLAALPGHPCIPGWSIADESARGVRIFMLPPEDRYKVRLLDTAGAVESDATAALNRELAAHDADGFQVRLKRVFESPTGRVMAKSAGWGWLGYHAWLAGNALEGFVPRPLRLRDGILFSEYADGVPLTAGDEDPVRLAGLLGSYVARRVNSLGLSEDPASSSPGYRWCGWDDLAATLSRVYGPYLEPLKKRAIRRRLRRFVAPNPTLVDGRMKPADWVRCRRKLIKTDFEHHNFGGGELDIVDPAWDLASAIFEFRLPPDAEQHLLKSYVAETADTGVEDRLLLYKILYCMSALRAAKYWLARKPNDERRQDWNRQFIATRSFAAFHVARDGGRKLGAAPVAWERRLCFLDLDGVLDWGLLGFPHTTPCGIEALRLFRQNRFSVVLNTARSLEHVREYCRAYRLPGGVAELGSVFWDAIRQRDVPLIDAQATAQMEILREEIQKLPGVFIDPENRYSIRAYRFQDGYMRPLQTAEIETVLERGGCHRLTFIQSPADTYVVQKGTGKGPALASVGAYLGGSAELVAAIGDSRLDVDMLRAADVAYAPANASREVRELVARGECRRTRRTLQAGLLEAARELCRAAQPVPEPRPEPMLERMPLLDELLQFPDRRLAERIFSTLRWWRL